MKHLLVFGIVVLWGLALLCDSDARLPEIKTIPLTVEGLNFQSLTMSLYFIPNRGQVHEEAQFYARTPSYTLWLTKKGLVFDRVRKVEEGEQMTDYSTQPSKFLRDVSRLVFLDANKNPEIISIDEAKLRVNYFIGNDKSKWHCDIPTSIAVLYKNLYKKIDLKVYGIEKQIEYDWMVKPGGDPGDIRFEYKNVKGTRIDEEGNLLIETDFGELKHKKPVSYQTCKALSKGVEAGLRACPKERKYVNVTFKKLAGNTYGFEVADYNKNFTLIIDPIVLANSTYLGAGSNDNGRGIAVDGSGYAYITGGTISTDFPILNQSRSDQKDEDIDVFVTKLDTTQSGASSLLYSTYLGGGSFDYVRGIAVNGSGHAYVTGTTESTDFPTINQYQANQDGADVFVTKLDTTQSGASSLLYSTYLGAGGFDGAWGIAVDGSGYAYVTGLTTSIDFPTLNQYQVNQDGADVFVTKLDTTQSGTSCLLYSTYLGAGSHDTGHGIAVDGSGYAYVTGFTASTDFPTLNQYQVHQGGGGDVFVTKLDTTQSGASCLLYSTYLGGELTIVSMALLSTAAVMPM